MGKNYKRPELAMPEAFYTDFSTDTSSNLSEISWKDYFSDTVLLALIDSGLHNNYDLLIAEQRVIQANALLMQSRGALIPSFSGGGAVGIADPGDNSLQGKNINAANATGNNIPIPIENYQLDLSMSWEIDFWGRLRRLKESAKAQVAQTEMAQRALETVLVANIASLYYELLSLDIKLEVINKNIALQEEAFRVVKLQKEGGRANEVGVKQIEAQLLNTKGLKPAVLQQMVVTENALNYLLGRYPQEIHRGDSLMQQELPETAFTGIPSELLQRRPDILVAEYSLMAANANVGAAKAAFYPTISLSATGFMNSFDAGEFFSLPASLGYSVAGGLVAPIFQGNAIRAQYKSTEAEREQALFQYQQSIITSFNEVINSLVAVNQLEEQKSLKVLEVDALLKAAHFSNELFKSGYANYLEVITAQNNALVAELDLADIQKEQLISLVELYRSLGGGWE
ncbi:TolC family protein [Algivirga pacifica]|uniref:TolC family protein n=2 Tax=Algivirga pacifica TaxID=1162670 RepID=A0ABP9DDY6_9BACT